MLIFYVSNSRATSSLFSPSFSHPHFFAGNRLVPTIVCVCGCGVCVCECVFLAHAFSTSFSPRALVPPSFLAAAVPCRAVTGGRAVVFLSTVYVAPLKALARERLKDWREKFGKKIGMGVLELMGDHTPDGDALRCADLMRGFSLYVNLPSPIPPQPVTPTFLSSLVLFFPSVFLAL